MSYIIISFNNIPEESRSAGCSICISEFSANQMVYKTECNHFFHSKCLNPWLNGHYTCPYCRSHLRDVVEPIDIVRGNAIPLAHIQIDLSWLLSSLN